MPDKPRTTTKKLTEAAMEKAVLLFKANEFLLRKRLNKCALRGNGKLPFVMAEFAAHIMHEFFASFKRGGE